MATLPAIVVVQRLTQRVDQRRERGLPVISASDYRTDSRTAAAAAAASPVSAASVWLPVAASTSVTTPATHRRRARSLADRGAEGPVHQGASERGDTHGLGHVDGGGGLGGGLAQRRRRRMSHAWRRPSRVVDTAVLEMASGRLALEVRGVFLKLKVAVAAKGERRCGADDEQPVERGGMVGSGGGGQ